MSPLLLAPLGLAALAALLVPLAIHLRRRTEEVPVDFAALRWLDPLPRPRRRLRFDEWLLLALRLLLVAGLALLLARPAVLGWEDDDARVLAAPGVDPAEARRIAGPEAAVQWIAPGFPALGTAPPAAARAPLSSLIRQFDAELPPGAPLTILVPPVLDGVDAERLRLTRKVTWRIVRAGRAANTPKPPEPPALVVVGGAGAQRYFRAAAAAWRDPPRFAAQDAEAALPPRDSVLVWLTPGPVPVRVTDWVSGGGTALLAAEAALAMPAATTALWRDGAGQTLVEGAPLGAGRVLRFTRRLEPAAIPELLEGDLPARLAALLTPAAPPPARVDAAAFAPVAGTAPYPLPPRDLTPWLAVLIAVIFLAERLLAARRARFAP